MSRRKYIWDAEAQQLVEVSTDYAPERRTAGAPVTDLYMNGVRATDGTDIGSRAKRREYMRVHNLADADDFRGEWARKAQERERAHDNPQAVAKRRADIARALNQARGRR